MKIEDKIEWLIPKEEVEQGALDQIYNVAEIDLVKKMAIMPDVHQGYDMPIGGVALIDNHISPAYIGYDEGCGMCYVDTHIPVEDMFQDEREKINIYNMINKEIPMGVGVGHSTPQEYKKFISASGNKELDEIINHKIVTQLYSLGSGNHFLEVGITQSGTVSVTIHSGSRGAGWKSSDYYMKLEKKEGVVKTGKNKKGEDTFCLLDYDSDLGKAYYEDLNFFLQYALDNRKGMMRDIIKILGCDWNLYENAMINKTHNHAEITEDGILHRKGATSSYENEMGIIPGNMRDGVWIVKGLGNETFLNSSSHGAGRTKSRKQAKKDTTMEQFSDSMTGIIAKVTEKTLDESPFAYKDIKKVIERQEGVVIDVIDKTKPIINIKAEGRR